MIKKFEIKEFKIPKLKGISDKTMEEHLKLYQGYVKNANLVLEKIKKMSEDSESAYEVAELQRRFSFEFNGMRNHEYYFASFENGSKSLNENSEFKKAIEEECGDFDKWLNRFKAIALTRGVGWAMLYYDSQTKKLLNQWVDEHHFGCLSSCAPILTLDMWEHSFVADYQPSGKKNYIEDFFENLNWQIIEENFKEAVK